MDYGQFIALKKLINDKFQVLDTRRWNGCRPSGLWASGRCRMVNDHFQTTLLAKVKHFDHVSLSRPGRFHS